ncbi:MAG: hypothetical protein ACRCYE_02420, partial [Sarcina sp.]
MKILIITTGALPVPATDGGAVENLIEEFLLYNESIKKLNIDVVSLWTSDAERLSRKYKYSKFIWIKIKFIGMIRKVFCFFINRVSQNY